MKKPNTGKKFEELFKLSAIEQGYDYTRLKDAGFVGDKSSSRRFTPKNICDCIVFGNRQIYFLELKSRKSALRFDEITQIEDLKNKCKSLMSPHTHGGSAGVLVHFQDTDRVFYYYAMITDQLESDCGKKSFNTRDMIALSDKHPSLCFELTKFIPTGKRKARIDLSPLF